MKRILIAMAMFTLWAGAASAQALEQDFVKDISADKDWHFQVTPYLWFAGIEGNITAGPYQADYDTSFSDIFHHLKFGVMVTEQVRKGRIVFVSDQLYIKVGSQEVKAAGGFPPETTINARNNTFYWDNEIGYRGIATDRFALDALIGLQYWYINAGLNANPPIDPTGNGIYKSTGFVNPVLGMQAKAKLFKGVEGFAKADIGGYGVGSSLTGQVTAGIGIPIKSAGVDLGYRRLYVNQSHGIVATQTTLTGLFLGFTFGK
jgi:opacity protein-like surface antigen